MGAVPTISETIEAWGVVAADTITALPEAIVARFDSAENDIFRSFMIGDNQRVEAAQAVRENQAEIIEVREKQEKDSDAADMVMDDSLEQMREDQRERIEGMSDFQYGDFEYDNEDIDAAIAKAMDDKDAFYQQYRDKGWSEDRIDVLYGHLAAMEGMTKEEKKAYIDDLQARDPQQAEDLHRHYDEEARLSDEVTLTQDKLDNHAEWEMSETSYADEMDGMAAPEPTMVAETDTNLQPQTPAPVANIDLSFG